MTSQPPLIDDFRPQTVVRPASGPELGHIIRRAAAENLGLYPFGGATTLHLGLPPTKAGLAVDMTGLDQVIDYPARDMTITVQAGITIAKLQQVLTKENQRLPIDVPMPEKATLGGAIAVNASGPRRYGFGTLRDYVIGISFMNDGGSEVKAGGRVVKNVAGYDLCKLHIGALGTLGIVTQVTLKLRPRPEASCWLMGAVGGSELEIVLGRLHESAVRPVALDVSSPRPATTSGLATAVGARWNVALLFEDNAETVAWQVEQIERAHAGVFKEVSADDAVVVTSLADQSNCLKARANILPSHVGGFLAHCLTLTPRPHVHAHAGNGIVSASWFESLQPAQALSMVTTLRKKAATGHGNLVITRCPPDWKREVNVWGEPRGDLALMRSVKQALDPRDLFNPGRFLV